MPTITPTNETPASVEAEVKAHSRPEPKLQPMRIVKAQETPLPVSAIAQTRSAVPEKSLVVGKKEYEAAKKAKTNSKKNSQVSPLAYQPDPNPKTNEERNMSKEIKKLEETNEFPLEWQEAGYTRVYRAWTQTPISISGIVSSESTFTPGLKFADLVMAKDSEVLWIRCKGIEFFTPLANVKCGITKEK